MTETVSDAQKERNILQLELESERFKQSYSEEIIQKEKQNNREQKRLLDQKKLEVDELKEQLASKKETNSSFFLENKTDNTTVDELKYQISSMKLELDESYNTNRILRMELKEKVETDKELNNAPKNKKIADLLKANQQLKIELTMVQQSVGEVMLIAQKQAREMIEAAEKKVEITVEEAKQELLDIGFKAHQLTKDVRDSQIQVNDVYDELTSHLSNLAEREFGH